MGYRSWFLARFLMIVNSFASYLTVWRYERENGDRFAFNLKFKFSSFDPLILYPKAAIALVDFITLLYCLPRQTNGLRYGDFLPVSL